MKIGQMTLTEGGFMGLW